MNLMRLEQPLECRPRSLPESIARRITTVIPVPNMVTRRKEHMLAEFPQHVHRQQQVANRFMPFLQAIPKANMELVNISKPPVFTVEPAPQLGFSLLKVASMDDADAWQELTRYLNDGAQQIVSYLATGLESLREKDMVGEISYPDDGVVAYNGSVFTVEDKAVAVRDRKRRTETDIVRTLKQRKSYHELMDAHWHSPHDMTVPRPARVQDFIQKIPPELENFIKIVAGKEIYTEVMEREIHSEQRTEVVEKPRVIPQNVFRPDPALVLGPYVLCSW